MHPTDYNTKEGDCSDETDVDVNKEESNKTSKDGKTRSTKTNEIPCLHELDPCSEDGKHSTPTPNLKVHTSSSHTDKNPDINDAIEAKTIPGNKMQNMHNTNEKDMENSNNTNNVTPSNIKVGPIIITMTTDDDTTNRHR